MDSIRRIFSGFRLTKRKEFVVITAGATAGFIGMQFATPGIHFWLVFFLGALALLLSAIGLREGLKGIKYGMLLLLPVAYTVSLGLFYFLLPVRWLTRLPVAMLYAVGMYAILLVENIYNVAVNRSIQLLRVAHAVGLLATLATLYFFFNTLFSFRFQAPVNMITVFFVQFPLILQSLWSVDLHEKLSGRLILYSLAFSLIGAEAALVISYWPLKPILASLLLVTFNYTLIGIGQHALAKRLFRKYIVEYSLVFTVVLLLIIVSTRYR